MAMGSGAMLVPLYLAEISPSEIRGGIGLFFYLSGNFTL